MGKYTVKFPAALMSGSGRSTTGVSSNQGVMAWAEATVRLLARNTDTNKPATINNPATANNLPDASSRRMSDAPGGQDGGKSSGYATMPDLTRQVEGQC